jgi:hypothetical protein
MPCAVLTYAIRNRARARLSGAVFGNLRNFVGEKEGRANEPRAGDGLAGLFCANAELGEGDPRRGSLFLGTTSPGASVWPRWTDDRRWKFWEAVAGPGPFPPPDGTADVGTVAAPLEVAKGETVSVTFLLTWHFPNFEKYWGSCDEGRRRAVWRNWYAGEWRDAFEVARELARDLDALQGKTRAFHGALFSSTLPAHVLDAVSANLSTLRTNTCVRLPHGTLYGWEGCDDGSGCCEGSCTHVWDYAQAQAFLFPALQRSMRQADYEHNMLDDGLCQFRMPLPPGTKAEGGMHPAADGQMGAIVQVWREWLLGAGDDWLRAMWPRAKRALEFAWRYWDADRDGVMEGMQHNTYDIELHGPNSFCTGLYLAALRAAERMARRLGDGESADGYARLAAEGARRLADLTFNGEYFEQKVNASARDAWPEPWRSMGDRGLDDRFADWPRWQCGRGCLSDQAMGCWLARVAGLGDVLDPARVRSALRAIFRHNWRPDLTEHVNSWRLYALRDEAGLLVASWPRGGRPGYPMWYCDEVWPGVEYQVASHMIYEGMLEEGLAVVRGCRDRFTGGRRNPWDEFECGHHYARSLASWAVLTALSGFEFSAPERRLGFEPRVSAPDFRSFFSSGTAWGVYSQRWKGSGGRIAVEVLGGRLELARLDFVVPGRKKRSKRRPSLVEASVGGSERGCSVDGSGGRFHALFEPALALGPGETLELAVKT